MSIKSALGCQFGACSNADHKNKDLKLLKMAQGFLVFPIGCVSSSLCGSFLYHNLLRWIFVVVMGYVSVGNDCGGQVLLADTSEPQNSWLPPWLQDKSQAVVWLVLLIFLSRFEERLHQYLAEEMEPLSDFVGLPLYLPQSLVTTPTVTCPLKSPVSSQQVRKCGTEN